MQATFKLFLSCLFCLSLTLLSGCGKSGSSALVGIWSIEEGQSNYGVPEDLELLKDGTGIVDGRGITWKPEGNRFYLTHLLQARAWDYKISNSILTLTNNDGQSITYKRVTAQEQRTASQRRRGFSDIKNLAGAVARYEYSVGRPPTTEQGLAALQHPPAELRNPTAWAGPYIANNKTAIDPWGNEYQYISPGRNGKMFDIWSFGPDGIDSTAADIGS